MAVNWAMPAYMARSGELLRRVNSVAIGVILAKATRFCTAKFGVPTAMRSAPKPIMTRLAAPMSQPDEKTYTDNK
jgi:hypothetical protein